MNEAEDFDDSFAEKVLNFNDEEGDVWDEESAYLEMLANEVNWLKAVLYSVSMLNRPSAERPLAREISEGSRRRLRLR